MQQLVNQSHLCFEALACIPIRVNTLFHLQSKNPKICVESILPAGWSIWWPTQRFLVSKTIQIAPKRSYSRPASNSEQVGRVGCHLKYFVLMCKLHYNHLIAAILTFNRPVIVFPCKIPALNAFSRLKYPE